MRDGHLNLNWLEVFGPHLKHISDDFTKTTGNSSNNYTGPPEGTSCVT